MVITTFDREIKNWVACTWKVYFYVGKWSQLEQDIR